MYAGFVILEEGPANPYLVDKIIYHKNYKPKTMKNDIALIRLAKPLALNGNFESVAISFSFPSCSTFKLRIDDYCH